LAEVEENCVFFGVEGFVTVIEYAFYAGVGFEVAGKLSEPEFTEF
jgi:hypothetical protein